jgi:SNF2 family DNA or RNA helicase
VFVHYLIARGTVDEVVLARRDGKRTVQDLLMDYMKRTK